jgi:hypothetical protein
MIGLYNGFYTLDGYFANYDLRYKHRFRKIIEKELAKNESIRNFFDHYGSYCSLLTAEVGRNFFVRKTEDAAIRNLELNTQALKDMGGEFILSAVEIVNHRANHLEFLRAFEKEDLPLKIYLYHVM